MKKYLYLLLLPLTLHGQGMNEVSGTINYYYISRLSDGAIINLPYRIADIKWQRGNNTFSLYSHLAMEYRIPSDSHFLDSTSPQDFSWDLRELYLSWQLNNGEIRIGKQIQSWGSVDGNSPVDNLNAYDYYYLFESGPDQKIGALATAGDFYLGSWKFGFSLSPIHHTNRLPINDSEFPVDLPVSPPTASQVIKINKPIEFGGYITKSFSKGDVTLSYFDGYDRVFSPSGFNVWQDANQILPHITDTVYCYRQTQVRGLGTVLFLGDLTLRSDIAYFTTKDPNNNVERDFSGNNDFYTTMTNTHSFKINAEYYQANIQFEYELPWDLQFSGQYVQYDTLSFFADQLKADIPIANIHADDFKPAEYFFPGLGTPMAILTKNVLLLDVTKKLSDNRAELSLQAMMDQTHSGKLIEMGFEYDISESLHSYLAVNKVFGDKSQDEKYTFNHMEDFSHIRLELKYYY